MFTKQTKPVALAIVTGLISLLITAAPVLASTGQTNNLASQSTQPGMSASSASAPISGWLQIAPHSSQWFKFKYSYDDTAKDNTPAQALVKLVMQNPGSVSFDVWTPDRLQNPEFATGDTHHRNPMYVPAGVGSPQFLDETHHRDSDGSLDIMDQTNPDVLIWSGSQRATDTFYVQVINKTDAPANYELMVNGPTVTY